MTVECGLGVPRDAPALKGKPEQMRMVESVAREGVLKAQCLIDVYLGDADKENNLSVSMFSQSVLIKLASPQAEQLSKFL